MMGHRQIEQAALFYEFSLERHVPADHLFRSIDRFVELGELRLELAAFYSTMGRPSIDPELMIRMLIVGYCFGLRSERRLCEEVHLNLAYRWFCPLGLDGHLPDHSTFSKNGHGRFRESDLLRRVFETVPQRCICEGLVGGEAFAIDASLIKADANRQKGIEGEKGLPPEATGRAVAEYVAVLDDAAFGAATDVVPKFVSPPIPRWTGAHGGQAFFANSTNYLIDVDNGVIVDVEATTAIRQAEVLAAKRMIERSMDPLRSLSRTPPGRQRLRRSRDARMARLQAWHRATCDRVARQHTDSTIWSCLAAHAAVLHVDGIQRSPPTEKPFALFDFQKFADHPMTQAMCAPPRIPHSRYNDLPEHSYLLRL
jgi:transposase